MDQNFEAHTKQLRAFKKVHGDTSVKYVIIHVGTNHLLRDNPVDVAKKSADVHASKEFEMMVHASKEFRKMYFSATIPKLAGSFQSMINYVNNEAFNLCLDNQKM